jgi:hypothetical protein
MCRRRLKNEADFWRTRPCHCLYGQALVLAIFILKFVLRCNDCRDQHTRMASAITMNASPHAGNHHNYLFSIPISKVISNFERNSAPGGVAYTVFVHCSDGRIIRRNEPLWRCVCPSAVLW